MLDAGPDRPTAFHVVGGQFDAAYAEGAWLLRRADPAARRAWHLPRRRAGSSSCRSPNPGDYPFLSHVMVDAERGAHGTIRVTR